MYNLVRLARNLHVDFAAIHLLIKMNTNNVKFKTHYSNVNDSNNNDADLDGLMV